MLVPLLTVVSVMFYVVLVIASVKKLMYLRILLRVIAMESVDYKRDASFFLVRKGQDYTKY